MTWYRTGSVNVTTGDTAVIGVDTKFVTNARVGDAFRGPDGYLYEVINIASETSMGIYPAYQGASASGSTNYTIAPVQGYNKDLADRLRAITLSYAGFEQDLQEAKAAATSAQNSATQAATSFAYADSAKYQAMDAQAAAEAAQASAANSATNATQAAQDAVTAANMLDDAIESGVLPNIPDENAHFIMNGGDISQWVTTGNVQIGSGMAGDSLITTISRNNTAGDARAWIPVGNPSGNADYIMYAKVLCNHGVGLDYNDPVTGKGATVLFGFSTPTATIDPGRISVRGFYSGTATFAAAPKTYNYTGEYLEIAVHYCNKYNTLNLWVKQSGKWELAARVQHERFTLENMGVAFAGTSALDATVLLQYQQICYPNIVIYGDSISTGSNDYDPNFGFTDRQKSDNIWSVHAGMYPMIRNNLPVLKGTGGWTSQMYRNGINKVTETKGRVVFFHASSNDATAGATFADRTNLMQQCIDLMGQAGMNVVLLNQLPATQAHFDNATGKIRDYCHTWWRDYRHTLRGIGQALDIARVLAGVDGYQDVALTEADGIHPTTEGYTKIGLRWRWFYSQGSSIKTLDQPMNVKLTALSNQIGVANSLLAWNGPAGFTNVPLSSIQRSADLMEIDGVTDYNSIVSPGVYQKLLGPSNPNTPSQSFYYVQVLRFAYNNSVTQIAYPFTTGVISGSIYHRSLYNGVSWSPWSRLITDKDTATSATDSTLGKLMGVGAFGLGADVVAHSGVNEPLKPTGFYQYNGTAIAGITTGTLFETRWGGVWNTQLLMEIGGSNLAYRSLNYQGGTTNWARVITSQNVASPISNDVNVSGGVMEYGTNANGEYWKFYNGLLICQMTFVGHAPNSILSKSWPHAFLNTANPGSVYSSVFPTDSRVFTSAAWMTYDVGAWVTSEAGSSGNIVYLTAVGRWK